MPVRRIDYKTMDPRQIMKKQQEWADYVRMRRVPEKQCVKCKKTFPNDRSHFATNFSGRLLSTCISCAPLKGKAAVKQPEICPCCENRAILVHDRHAPAPVMLCRACLDLVNKVDTLTPETANRMSQYIEWRKKGNQAPLSVSIPGALPDPPLPAQENGPLPP